MALELLSWQPKRESWSAAVEAPVKQGEVVCPEYILGDLAQPIGQKTAKAG
ncbi:MAG TPA: hypothetical protein VGH03_15865 [Caulobacteraceae bacterium]|jgi:hypothetical protein